MTTEIQRALGPSGPECATFAPLLPILDEATIDPDARAAAEAHLITCPHCQARLLAFDQLDALLRRHFGPESVWAASAVIDTSAFDGDEPPMFTLDDVPEDYMQTDQGDARTPSTVRSARWPAGARRANNARLAAFGAIAAVLLIALLAGGLFVHFATPTTPAKQTATPDNRVTLFPLSYFSIDVVIVAGPDGAIWFSDNALTATAVPKLGRITPDGKITEYPVPTATVGGQGNEILSLATGSDGTIWFLHFGQGRVNGTGKPESIYALDHATATGEITEFPPAPIPTDATGAGALPFLVGGSGGALWLLSAEKLSGIPADAHIIQVTAPDGYHISSATVGPDGNLWLSARLAAKIVRITPDGTLATFPLPDPQLVATCITDGPDGAIWFCEDDRISGQITRGAIGRITPAGAVTSYPVPQGTIPTSISAGPDGTIWVALNSTQSSRHAQLMRIAPGSGTMTLYPLPDGFVGQPIAGPDGNLWFSFQDTRSNYSIGRFRLS